MPFVKRDRGGGGQRGGGERGSEKVGKEEEGSNGLSCKRCEDFSLESLQHEGERQNPDSLNHHSHHSTVRGEKSMIDSI